ncbi:unnamed protein product [Caenorhabditis bovis]|uniref:Uncharacterized protein n=1 Tax=Caenorhabditis bovis TaxID=2654633 RepID=A0A8S1EH95_9PELO|nr:unnamed protein product [Caenorhabditis bovis]
MEEADAFIIKQCKKLECSFADDINVEVDELTNDQIFELLIRIGDPRENIAKIIDDSWEAIYPRALTGKPAPPPKPPTTLAAMEKSCVLDEKKIRLNDLKAQLSEKKRFYEEKHLDLVQMLDKTEELKINLSEFDPLFIEALQDPKKYEVEILEQIDKLNDKMENDLQAAHALKCEKLAELEKLMKVLDNTAYGDNLRLQRLNEQRTRLFEETEKDLAMCEKLKLKICDGAENNLALFQKRCRDVEDIVRKQEHELAKIESESRHEYDKQILRMNEDIKAIEEDTIATIAKIRKVEPDFKYENY